MFPADARQLNQATSATSIDAVNYFSALPQIEKTTPETTRLESVILGFIRNKRIYDS